MSNPITNYLDVVSKSEKDNVKLYKFFYNHILNEEFVDLALNEKTKGIFGDKIDKFYKKNPNASENDLASYIENICGSTSLYIDKNEDETPILPEDVFGNSFYIQLSSDLPLGFYEMFSKYFNVKIYLSYTIWDTMYEGTRVFADGKQLRGKKAKQDWI